MTLFVVTVLATAYPLSLGPVEWFYTHGLLPESVAAAGEVFYAPITWVYGETVRRISLSYLDSWEEE